MKTIFENMLSEEFRKRVERIFIWIAIISFVLHLFIIFLVKEDVIHLSSKLTKSPIAAIYTPFSFILVYEVFLLVFYLPKSISSYIGKQYEIITLIVIRRIFKDIGYMELSPNWFKLQHDLQFTYDLATALILFFLIQQFYQRLAEHALNYKPKSFEDQARINQFIKFKKTIAIVLIPTVIMLALYSFINWIVVSEQNHWNDIATFKNINNIFFEDFFILLIIIDVILLLFSFFYSDSFHKIIRNSGFIISTILIKLSFSMEGIINNALILGAVIFGFLILLIHNSYKSNSFTEH
ncbi:cation transport ATPase [Pedobacter sp. UYEF25]